MVPFLQHKMPKICRNSSNCKFLKAPKGCKFLHVPINRDVLSAQVYSEIVSALNQANCNSECHTKNVGGRMTGRFLDDFSLDELSTLLSNPVDFATHMVTVLEALEESDGQRYVL